MPKLYCFDTSSILEGLVRYYPIDTFPNLWKNFDGMIEKNIIISSEEVLLELKKKDDDVYRWAKKRSNIFIPLDSPVQVEASEILKIFPRLVETRKNRSGADPFVIGLAKIKNGTLITQEKGGTVDKPKIPSVCQHYNIKTLSFTEFIVEQKWKF